MFNYIIAIVLLFAIISGSKASDFKPSIAQLPWWFFVISGFSVSLVGLFYFNEEKIVFIGCFLLFIAKILFWKENKKAELSSENEGTMENA